MCNRSFIWVIFFNFTHKFYALCNGIKTLEESIKKDTDDWLLADNKWNEAVVKIHLPNIEIYNNRTI